MSDLQHYLDSGEIPDDPAILEQLYKEATGIEAASEEQVETAKTDNAATGVTEVEQEEKTAEDEKQQEGEKEPDGILSKDGKHVIPYDALKSERQARQEYQRQVDELRQQVESLKNGNTQSDLPMFNAMTEAQLAELKEYFPEQFEAIMAQQAAYVATSQKLIQLEKIEQDRQVEQDRQTALTVQEEIDNNPLLSHWQRNNPEIWEMCKATDAKLRVDPLFADATLAERFSKVAASVAVIYGNPLAAIETKPPEAPTKQPAAKKVTETPPINSLSDLKGGESPVATDKQRIEEMSAAEIGDLFLNKSPEQIQAIINSL